MLVLLLAGLLGGLLPQVSGQDTSQRGGTGLGREVRQGYPLLVAGQVAQQPHRRESLARTSEKKEVKADLAEEASRARRAVYASTRARKLARMAARWERFLRG